MGDYNEEFEKEFGEYQEDEIHQLWLLLAAERYRHIVCLIDNYASSCLVLTKGWGRCSDSGIALEQTCRAVHAWYHWTTEERGFYDTMERWGDYDLTDLMDAEGGLS